MTTILVTLILMLIILAIANYRALAAAFGRPC